MLETIRINYVVLCGSDDMNFNDIEKKKDKPIFKGNSSSLGPL